MTMTLPLSRRGFLALGAGGLAAAALPRPSLGADGATEVRLTAARTQQSLVGPKYGETEVWSFSGAVPGPTIRVRQRGRLRAVVTNRLDQGTTVHWHGMRVPNAMDGVPDLTQPPIAPGETLTYEFDAPDAGTYWYHPHVRSFEQIDRGLAGALIVEERAPIQVDREVVWVLDDWRLDERARTVADFGNMHDVAHGGRIGNTVTINGRIQDSFAVRAGERIRLRLINTANARVFGLRFEGHTPTVVALDGQPVAPHAVSGDGLVLGPAMRADLILDAEGKPGAKHRVVDAFYRGYEYRLIDLAYSDEAPLRDSPLDAPVALAANTMPEPDLTTAQRHMVLLEGGAMMGMAMAQHDDGRPMPGMTYAEHTDWRALMQRGKAWIINGVAADEEKMDPLVTLPRGRTAILAMHNHTVWHHPMHLHGHSFRVISRNGKPTTHREWLDTVLLAPHDSAEVAFVADNPGDWLFHCHVLEHMLGGMSSIVRVG